MTLQQLKYAVTVAETKNITEASRKVFISQPSLTAAIHELESEMGITIFSRTNKGVTITNEGDEFLAYARQVLDQASLLEEHFKGEAETLLKLQYLEHQEHFQESREKVMACH